MQSYIVLGSLAALVLVVVIMVVIAVTTPSEEESLIDYDLELPCDLHRRLNCSICDGTPLDKAA